MLKIRIFFVISLVILVVLLVFTVFRPMASGEKFTTVMRESVIQREDQWIIQVDIINREGKDTDYTIKWSTGGETYNSKTVRIRSEQGFTDVHHVYPETSADGKIDLTIYKDDEPTPIAETTYYVSFDEE